MEYPPHLNDKRWIVTAYGFNGKPFMQQKGLTAKQAKDLGALWWRRSDVDKVEGKEVKE